MEIYSLILQCMPFWVIINLLIFIIAFFAKRVTVKSDRKQYFKNCFFKILLTFIFIGILLQGIGYYMQENMVSNPEEWHRALVIADIAHYFIIAGFIVRVALVIAKKISKTEYIITFLLNLVLFCSALLLITSRI